MMSRSRQPRATAAFAAAAASAATRGDDPREGREDDGGGRGVRRSEPDRSGSVYMLQGSATIVGKMQAMTAMDGTATVVETEGFDPENGVDGGCGVERAAFFENVRSLNPAFEDEFSEEIAKSEEQLLLNIGGMSFR